MERNRQFFVFNNPKLLKKKSLAWASQFDDCILLNANDIEYPFKPFKNVLAAEAHSYVKIERSTSFEDVKRAVDRVKDWLFGHFSYDLKNQIENLRSKNKDLLEFPEVSFFQPKHLIFFEARGITIETTEDPERIYSAIVNTVIHENKSYDLDLHPDTSKKQYLENVGNLKNHILEGEIYEINYCISFFSDQADVEPVGLYQSLVELSPTPFSAFYRNRNHYLLCASPERFLKKRMDKVTSQPIKGTARRGNSSYEDEIIKQQLRTDEKELAENMMIVDLVRNDLAKSCIPGTVEVEEMFGVYTFKQLHQMISTISGRLRPESHAVDTIKNAFPMGSMTGAPKVKVMELIEKYEHSKRGLFSGSVGYFTPNGDFDFNVVIRSVLLNKALQRIALHVGGAITYDSDPYKEYEECMLKASPLISLLSKNNY